MRFKVKIEYTQELDPDDMHAKPKSYFEMSKKMKDKIIKDIEDRLTADIREGQNMDANLYYARGNGTLTVNVSYIDDDYEGHWDEDTAGESYGY